MVGRDFNIISEAGERIGSPHFNFEGSLDFNSFMLMLLFFIVVFLEVNLPSAITDMGLLDCGLGLIDVYLIKLD